MMLPILQFGRYSFPLTALVNRLVVIEQEYAEGWTGLIEHFPKGVDGRPITRITFHWIAGPPTVMRDLVSIRECVGFIARANDTVGEETKPQWNKFLEQFEGKEN